MDLFNVTPNEKKNIHKLYNIEESQIKEKIEIIKKWIKGQSYLPQNLTDDAIERLLLRSKFDIEETEKNVDNYYKLRSEYPDYYKNSKNLVPSKLATIFLPLPHLTPNLERIHLYKVENPDPEFFDFHETAQIGLAISELKLQHDYNNGTRYICDFANFQYGHLNRTNPFPLYVMTSLIEKAYSDKIVRVEYFNCPPFITTFLEMIKMAVPPEMFRNVTIHENMESLHQVVPKECLPIEYGGPTYNISDITRKWDDTFNKHQKFFTENYETVRRFNY